jgi:[ribosomal protein S18]-alanine N-acetyltransferase
MAVETGKGRQADRRQAVELAAIHGMAFAGQERHWSESEIIALLTDPIVAVHIAYGEQRTAIGFALCRTMADEAELLTLAVMPDARREGRGAALLAACEEGALASGAARLFLEVAAGNMAAGALYTRAGYRECGRRKGYYLRPDGSRDDAVVMAKQL